MLPIISPNPLFATAVFCGCPPHVSLRGKGFSMPNAFIPVSMALESKKGENEIFPLLENPSRPVLKSMRLGSIELLAATLLKWPPIEVCSMLGGVNAGLE